MAPRWSRGIAGGLVGGTLLLAGTGCSGDSMSTLSPESHSESVITQIFWVTFVGSVIGFAVIVLLLFLGWWRRDTPTLPGGGDEKTATGVVIGLGVALPIVLLVALFVYSDLFALDSIAAPSKGSTQLTVEVTGKQFWWDVRYPVSGAVTANEIHIPVHTRVDIVARTADVIHSFWIPRLDKKMDMIPGQANHLLLEADEPGVYPGHCAEFCGLQHAHMAVEVIAEPRAQFEQWLAHNAQPAQGATIPQFAKGGCADCHQIRGTDAHGRVGPDLTHFASRTTIAALRIPNDPADLRHWLRDPQDVKPGNKMPNIALSDADWNALQRYLETLR